MSHTSKMSGIPLKSEATIRRAVAELQKQPGLENIKILERGQKPRMYQDYSGGAVRRGKQFDATAPEILGRKEIKAEDILTLELPGKYDVGFVWNAEKQEFEPIVDSWNGEVAKYLGCVDKSKKRGGYEATTADMGLFYQTYSAAETFMWAEEQGYSINHWERAENGEIHIEVGGMPGSLGGF